MVKLKKRVRQCASRAEALDYATSVLDRPTVLSAEIRGATVVWAEQDYGYEADPFGAVTREWRYE